MALARKICFSIDRFKKRKILKKFELAFKVFYKNKNQLTISYAKKSVVGLIPGWAIHLGVGPEDPCESFPTQNIPCFCDSDAQDYRLEHRNKSNHVLLFSKGIAEPQTLWKVSVQKCYVNMNWGKGDFSLKTPAREIWNRSYLISALLFLIHSPM